MPMRRSQEDAVAGRSPPSPSLRSQPGAPGIREDGGLRTRNPGVPFDAAWIRGMQVNRSGVERRARSLATRRSLEKEWQAAWLLRAITLMDLTTLSGDDTPGTVRRLCGKARQPLREDLIRALEVEALPIRPAAVCVHHAFVELAAGALQGTGIRVAAVSTGFPHGLSPMQAKLAEIRASAQMGAREIDVVITRSHALTGRWEELYDEIRAYREACGEAKLKTILATGELGPLEQVARASQVCMMAGADFIKTSTGTEAVNATLPGGLVMLRQIRAFRERTGFQVGFKPAGGIRTAREALLWMILMKEELGAEWLDPLSFRFGASSLLADIERELEHHVTGRYSAFHRHPMA
jgi:deoxyribose-phosphate aldolase